MRLAMLALATVALAALLWSERDPARPEQYEIAGRHARPGSALLPARTDPEGLRGATLPSADILQSPNPASVAPREVAPKDLARLLRKMQRRGFGPDTEGAPPDEVALDERVTDFAAGLQEGIGQQERTGP